MSKEKTIGAVSIFLALAVLGYATGIYGIFYFGLVFVVTVISINMFSRKSTTAKTGAVVLNTDLIYKILMPKKYKKGIKELEKNEEK